MQEGGGTMTKPWEETWAVEREDLIADDGTRSLAPWWNVSRSATSLVGTEFREEAAKLVAAAPDMARVLLDIEWSAEEGRFCPSCLHGRGEGHSDACALKAALMKAGL